MRLKVVQTLLVILFVFFTATLHLLIIVTDFDDRTAAAALVLPDMTSLGAAEMGANPELETGGTATSNDNPRTNNSGHKNFINRLQQRANTSLVATTVLQLQGNMSMPNGGKSHDDDVEPVAADGSTRFKRLLTSVENQLNVGASEHDVLPFTRFTLHKLYPTEVGLNRRSVEKLFGFKKRDLVEAVSFAANRLNIDRLRQTQYNASDLIEGLFRLVPGVGTQYEMYFRDKDNTTTRYHKVVVVRPHSALAVDSVHEIAVRDQLINIIVPVTAQRLDQLSLFIDRFVRFCRQFDKRVFLTVVYCGQLGLSVARSLVVQSAADHGYSDHFQFIPLADRDSSYPQRQQFSRGRALHAGVDAWKKLVSVGRFPATVDVLLFFCDVDVVFSADFFERCRLNSERGRRVYYPIVFSLYNPRFTSVNFTAAPRAAGPSTNQQGAVVTSSENGFWRDFGYGMTCQYLSDYKQVGGFNSSIAGWGLEDVDLYRKHVRTGRLTVIRAADPGLVHPWHEKSCDVTSLTADQFRDCIRSRAVGEASHVQLGLHVLRHSVETENIDTERASNNSDHRKFTTAYSRLFLYDRIVPNSGKPTMNTWNQYAVNGR